MQDVDQRFLSQIELARLANALEERVTRLQLERLGAEGLTHESRSVTHE
jgi:predicted lipoprotein